MFEEQIKIVYKIIDYCLEHKIFGKEQQFFLLQMRYNLEELEMWRS